MDRKIRVGAVSYLNTKPLLSGIRGSGLMEEIELLIDYPSRISTLLLDDRIDIGLVPVVVIPRMEKYYINTDYCIGSVGAVASVALFSASPIGEIKRILLDYQSDTSVQLAKILLREYWKIRPELVDTKEEFTQEIKGTTAGLVIGDRALAQRQISPFIYDLGEAWQSFSGLPFVFAAWISNKRLDKGFIERFNAANAMGIQEIDTLLKNMPSPSFDLKEYFTRNISYELDEPKWAGLQKFLGYLKSQVNG